MTGSNTVSVLFFIAPIGARDRARLPFRDLKSEKFSFSLENSWLATEFFDQRGGDRKKGQVLMSFGRKIREAFGFWLSLNT